MLNIVVGREAAGLYSFDLNTSQTVAAGEFASFSGGKLSKVAAIPLVAAATRVFPVFAGNDVRFDAKALNKATIATAKGAIFETDKFAAESFNPGEPLTVNTSGVLTKTITVGTHMTVAYALSSATGGTLQFVLA